MPQIHTSVGISSKAVYASIVALRKEPSVCHPAAIGWFGRASVSSFSAGRLLTSRMRVDRVLRYARSVTRHANHQDDTKSCCLLHARYPNAQFDAASAYLLGSADVDVLIGRGDEPADGLHLY